jgi:hypothetical protein
MTACARPGRRAPESGESFTARAAAANQDGVATRRRAALTVAGRARDAADCQLLLSVLGLDGLDGKPDDRFEAGDMLAPR